MAAVFTAINPKFIDKYNLISIGQNLAPYAMLALGVLMPALIPRPAVTAGNILHKTGRSGGSSP